MIYLSHNKWTKQCCRILQIAVFMFATCLSHAATREEAIKAGIVYNLTKFTVWPNDAMSENYLNICVFGKQHDDGFDALAGKVVMGKALMIKRNPNDRDIHTCQLAYIKNTSQKKIYKILNKCKSQPILTVSESLDFINHGGMIGLVAFDNHVGFEANIKAINSEGINIGAQLLKLAKRVIGLDKQYI